MALWAIIIRPLKHCLRLVYNIINSVVFFFSSAIQFILINISYITNFPEDKIAQGKKMKDF